MWHVNLYIHFLVFSSILISSSFLNSHNRKLARAAELRQSGQMLIIVKNVYLFWLRFKSIT